MAIKSILLDTNAYTAFKRNVPEAVEIIQQVPLIGLNSIIIGELLGGFTVGTKEEINRNELQLFLNHSRVRVLSINSQTSEYYAQVYGNLRRKGKPIPTNDMWIAATALQYDLGIFSYDQHFQFIENLVIGTGLEDFTDG
ncbi:MAG: type II toxin-antitoxin system VapC family toxin [Microcystaceae cyanobacterium]